MAFGENVPPAPPSVHVPPVAEPTTLPPNAGEVTPAQMALIAGPALTVGVASTRIVLEAVTAPHEPPLVFKVNVAVPEYVPGGVHVAFNVVAFGENVPPTPPSVHVPLVAEPPIVPPNGAEVSPWHIALNAGPAFTVAIGFTTIVLEAVTATHAPPLVVIVKVAVPE